MPTVKEGLKLFIPTPKELMFDTNNPYDKTISIQQIKDYFLHDKLIGTQEEDNFIKFLVTTT